jgi:Ca-activated chloride channel homolog
MRMAAVIVLAAMLGGLPQPAGQPVFTVAVDAVRVDVLVTHRGRPVAGLQASDFELRDNGVVQQIESVTREDVPVDLLLVFDVSGSVAGAPLAALREAAGAVLDQMDSNDRVALLTFSHRVSGAVPLTSDRIAARQTLEALTPSGATALFDAVYSSLLLRRSSSNRVMVLVFSDGYDTTSWFQPSAVVQKARGTDVVVYAVGLESPPHRVRQILPAVRGPGGESLIRSLTSVPVTESPPVSGFLEEITAATGGQVFRTADPRRMRDLFLQAVRDMKSRYVLSYVPEGVTREGWHDIEVRLTRRRGTITARPGYFIPYRHQVD